MSKEKSCKCCKQIWYIDMLEKKWGLCPNCYEYCKPLIDDLKIKNKKITKLQHRLDVAEKALELLSQSNISNVMEEERQPMIDYIKEQAENELKGESS